MLVMMLTCIFFLIASMLKGDGTDFEEVEARRRTTRRWRKSESCGSTEP